MAGLGTQRTAVELVDESKVLAVNVTVNAALRGLAAVNCIADVVTLMARTKGLENSVSRRGEFGITIVPFDCHIVAMTKYDEEDKGGEVAKDGEAEEGEIKEEEEEEKLKKK